MQETEKSYYEKIKSDYNEALTILNKLKEENKNEARRSKELLEKEM